ncbi:phosphate acetyltransferase [Desulfitobacterium metallireducens]|uniref:Phosphate acetyltransferase n=1 Tax=Desulfitobacterium metallireducens DSM 15288 TaxID=871968 RepID=W0EDW3_9FIRM|nr:phosphate acetyltransferase [Desulfitobacterium metallireducens]AHF07688.1 phosphotransacetylase [Desulfitobacterium metallireducens DSM 15288]
MGFLSTMKNLAKSDIQRIVLPEGEEERNLTAAATIHAEKVAEVILVGNEEVIKGNAKKLGINIEGIEIQDPAKSEKTSVYAKEFYELRKSKGVTEESAAKTLQDPLYYGTLMVKMNDAQGMVSGAIHTTGDLLKPGLQIIKTAPGISVVSSFFVMLLQNKEYGEDGTMLFADCAVNPNPNEDELAAIAISTAETAKNLCKMDPKVAMLSFSTMGSAKHENVTKVQNAVKKANELRPDLAIDGELQADAALVEKVGKLKAPNSKVAGEANVLVFPDLQAGNIGYKLVQRLAGAEAIGPICQGFAKPINDLSRGCSAEDIVNVVAITAVQAQTLKK